MDKKVCFTYVNLDYQKEFLILNIEDNGLGFNVNDQLKKNDEKGSGLLNLRNRAVALNAELTIKSRPHEGTSIFIRMPL